MWKRASEFTSLAAWPTARSLTPRASNEQPLPSLLTTSFSCRLRAKARLPPLRPVPYTQLHFVFLDEGLYSVNTLKELHCMPIITQIWFISISLEAKYKCFVQTLISNRCSNNFIDYLYFIISIAFWLICIMVIHHTQDLKSNWNEFHCSISLLDQYHFSSDTTLNCDLSSFFIRRYNKARWQLFSSFALGCVSISYR